MSKYNWEQKVVRNVDEDLKVYNPLSKEFEDIGGNGGLPEVSDEDNGDVLTVVDGEWKKATPNGGLTLYGPYSLPLKKTGATSDGATAVLTTVDESEGGLIDESNNTPVEYPSSDAILLLSRVNAKNDLMGWFLPSYYDGVWDNGFIKVINRTGSTLNEMSGHFTFYSTVEFPPVGE